MILRLSAPQFLTPESTKSEIQPKYFLILAYKNSFTNDWLVLQTKNKENKTITRLMQRWIQQFLPRLATGYRSRRPTAPFKFFLSEIRLCQKYNSKAVSSGYFFKQMKKWDIIGGAGKFLSVSAFSLIMNWLRDTRNHQLIFLKIKWSSFYSVKSNKMNVFTYNYLYTYTAL